MVVYLQQSVGVKGLWFGAHQPVEIVPPPPHIAAVVFVYRTKHVVYMLERVPLLYR